MCRKLFAIALVCGSCIMPSAAEEAAGQYQDDSGKVLAADGTALGYKEFEPLFDDDASDKAQNVDSYLEGFEGYLAYSAATPKQPTANEGIQNLLSNIGYPRVPDNPSLHIYPIENFGPIQIARDAEVKLKFERAYRGGPLGWDAKEIDFKMLHEIGVKAVINLDHYLVDSPQLCAKYGMTCKRFIHIPLDWNTWADTNNFQEAFKFATDEIKAGRKIYVHCAGGIDRTGVFAAALYIRGQFCELGNPSDSDKAEVIANVKTEMAKYRFWAPWFSNWDNEAQDWARNFEQHKKWICQ